MSQTKIAIPLSQIAPIMLLRFELFQQIDSNRMMHAIREDFREKGLLK